MTSLATLLSEIETPAPDEHWVFRWNVIPIVCCLVILIFVGHAVGEF